MYKLKSVHIFAFLSVIIISFSPFYFLLKTNILIDILGAPQADFLFDADKKGATISTNFQVPRKALFQFYFDLYFYLTTRMIAPAFSNWRVAPVDIQMENGLILEFLFRWNSKLAGFNPTETR